MERMARWVWAVALIGCGAGGGQDRVSPPTQARIVRRADAVVVNLGSKVITKYTAADRQLEVNHMRVDGRHPEHPDHFVLEAEVRFMLYVLRGPGQVWLGSESYTLYEGDVVDVPPGTRFAVAGEGLEYLVFQQPAWFSSQASIVDRDDRIVQQPER